MTFYEFLQVIIGLIAFWIGASIGIKLWSK
jgi:hypothetical protein